MLDPTSHLVKTHQEAGQEWHFNVTKINSQMGNPFLYHLSILLVDNLMIIVTQFSFHNRENSIKKIEKILATKSLCS